MADVHPTEQQTNVFFTDVVWNTIIDFLPPAEYHNTLLTNSYLHGVTCRNNYYLLSFLRSYLDRKTNMKPPGRLPPLSFLKEMNDKLKRWNKFFTGAMSLGRLLSFGMEFMPEYLYLLKYWSWMLEEAVYLDAGRGSELATIARTCLKIIQSITIGAPVDESQLLSANYCLDYFSTGKTYRSKTSVTKILKNLSNSINQQYHSIDILKVMLKKDGRLLEKYSNEFKDNKEFVILAVSSKGSALEFASPRLQADFEVVLCAVRNYGLALQFASAELKRNTRLILAAVKNCKDYCYEESDNVWQFISTDILKDNKQLILDLVRIDDAAYQHFSQYIKPSDDEEFMMQLVHVNPNVFCRIPPIHLRSLSRKLVLQAVKTASITILDCLPMDMRHDREIVLEAVKRRGFSIAYTSKELQEDREIVMEAIKTSEYALTYTSTELKNDRELVKLAVQYHPNALQYAPESMRNDKEIVMLALSNCTQIHTQVLCNVSEQLRDDEQVIMIAVKKNGMLLNYASDRLRANKNILIEAVSQNSAAYKYCKAEYPEVLCLINQPSWILPRDSRYREDKELIMKMVKQCGKNLSFASESLKNDKEVVAIAVGQNGEALQLASPKLQDDDEIVSIALHSNFQALFNVSQRIRGSYIGDLSTIADNLNYY